MARPLLSSLFDETERRPLTVSELTAQVRGAIENRFASVWLEGEISNFKAHTSGHWYFTIKDASSQIRSVCLRPSNSRIRFRPSNGLQVRARGRLTVYEPRGEYELLVEKLDPVGAGALRVAFEQLKEKLEREGLFDESIKRPLAVLPRRIAVVTSLSGAALHDILNILTRRTRTVDVVIAPVRVQGEGAGEQIAAAIDLINEYAQSADAKQSVDTIIISRGGGSIEDLWAFNAEEIARAIRRSAIPIISAVGHEIDFTIADFAADVRAPTPSAAAELVAFSEDALAAQVRELTEDLVRAAHHILLDARARLHQTADSSAFNSVLERLREMDERRYAAHHRIEILITRRLEIERRKLEATTRRLSPARTVRRATTARARFAVAEAELHATTRAAVERNAARLGLAVASLDALSPLAVLKRGYSIVQNERGRVVRDANDASAGERINVRLSAGNLACTINNVETKN